MSMDLEQVTLTQMRYAVALERFRNFRATARHCHISQSGLSMQIRKLEELLGLSLFDRSKKPVLVTRRGETALRHMRSVLRETQRLGQVVVEDTEPAGPYRLGVIPTLSSTVLPLFLRRFAQRYDRVELIIEELTTGDIISRLQADTLDAGLAATPLGVAGLEEQLLGKEAMLAYLPPGDPLAKKKAVRQRDLLERQLWVMPEGHCFRSQVLSYCGGEHPANPAQIQFESGSFQTLIGLVDDGLGATVIPALVAAGLPARVRKARTRPLSGPTPVREIGLVTARTDLRARVAAALGDAIRGALDQALAPTTRGAVTLSPVEQTD